jgi:homocysteine S-methyltransferase
LAEGGVDLFVFETFRHLDELGIAVAAARRAAPDVPILAMVTFDEGGTVADGTGPEKVAERLLGMKVDAMGINHGDGPQLALSMAERMHVEIPFCVQPNAGLPRTVDGRQLYMATPEYFDVFARRIFQAGARMVGGCCGTTPEHIRWMAKSARMLGGGARPSPVARQVISSERPVGIEPTPLAERSKFAAKLAAGKFVVSVEVNPAPGLDP